MNIGVKQREQMNVVIVGHVDHGKSTLIGRLLADTGSLPEGKLAAVEANCKRNSKPFEYAFLLDALKDEQSQGITIDTARCFFKSKKRDYIIIDAPGHIEFLKNMVTGAARAEAAILVIDAHEGIQENSKRHGYMMSFLGVKNITVCVNKMDLVDYSEEVFEKIKKEYTAFLNEIHLELDNFIPVSAREGDNIILPSNNMPWYKGSSALEALDEFAKVAPNHARDLRFPVQDIYKFTAEGDDRRIIAGRVESGSVRVGDKVTFLPSQKSSRVTAIEGFNVAKQKEVSAGQSVGFSLETQIYIHPGDIMCKASEQNPHVGSQFRANIFWMGKQPFVKGKNYKLKLVTQQVPVVLADIVHVLDASELSSIENKLQVDRHDVAECILETLKPVAFDEVHNISETGRFVIVDNYEIVGGGIVLAPVFDEKTVVTNRVRTRNFSWKRSDITPEKRAEQYQHKSALVVMAGGFKTGKIDIAKALEKKLFCMGKFAYFLGIPNEVLLGGIGSNDRVLEKARHIQNLGEMSYLFSDAGMILITSISNIDQYEIDKLKILNSPNKTFVVNAGENTFPEGYVDLILPANDDPEEAAQKIAEPLLKALQPDPA